MNEFLDSEIIEKRSRSNRALKKYVLLSFLVNILVGFFYHHKVFVLEFLKDIFRSIWHSIVISIIFSFVIFIIYSAIKLVRLRNFGFLKTINAYLVSILIGNALWLSLMIFSLIINVVRNW